MTPGRHAAVSLGLGLMLWWITASFASLILSLMAGFLIDIDHTVEYLRYLLSHKADRMFFLLHSFELLLPLWVVALLSDWQLEALVITLAFLVHIVSDVFSHGVNPLAYFFVYRASRGFDFKALAKAKRPNAASFWVQRNPRTWW